MSVKKLSEVAAVEVPAGYKTSMQVLISSEEGPHFAMRRFVIEAGGAMPLHTNTVEHEQLVLGGKAEVKIGNDIYHLKKDHVVFIPAGVPHYYKNTGDEPFEFLCLVPNKKDTIALVNDSK